MFVGPTGFAPICSGQCPPASIFIFYMVDHIGVFFEFTNKLFAFLFLDESFCFSGLASVPARNNEEFLPVVGKFR